jgi:hypothetical protein
MRRAGQAAAIIVVTLGVLAAYLKLQPQIEYAGGKSMDGTQYSAFYDRFAGAASSPEFPFCRRPAVPWLASRLGMDETRAFLTVNLVAGAITVLLCFMTLLEVFRPRIAWFAILPMLFGIVGPIRYPNYYPYLVDVPAMALYALAAWLVVKRLGVAAVVVLALSTVVKETGVVFAAVFSCCLVLNAAAGTRRRLALTLLVITAGGAVLGSVVASRFCETSGGYVWKMLTYGYIHVRNPWGVLEMIAAASLVAGPFVFDWFYGRDRSRRPFALDDPFCAAAVVTVAMAVVGGSDVTRYFFAAYPLYMVWLARQAERLPGLELSVLALAGLTANRFLERIPDQSGEGGLLDVKSYFSVVPEHGPVSVSLALIAFWAVTYFAVDRLAQHMRAPRAARDAK